MSREIDCERVPDGSMIGCFPGAVCYRWGGVRNPSGANLTFGTLAGWPEPTETQASSRYHPLRSDH